MKISVASIGAFAHKNNVGLIVACLVRCLVLVLISHTVVSAAGTVVTNSDRNALIHVQDASIDGPRTRILYFTTPDITQTHAAEDCTANFYLLELRAGLENVQSRLLVENFCGFFGMSGTLLANGDVLIVAGNRVEMWRPGSGQMNSWNLSDVSSLQGYWNEINDGTTPLDVASDGNIVIAKGLPRARNDSEKASGIVVGLAADGSLRWRSELAEPGVLLGLVDVWATADGGALLHATAAPMSGAGLPGTDAPAGSVIVSQNRLYRIAANGELLVPIVVASMQMPDLSTPGTAFPDPLQDAAGLQARLQAALQGQQAPQTMDALTFGDVVAHPRPDGGVDLLMGHGNDGADFLRISPSGAVMIEASLSEAMTAEGLRTWTDFAALDGQVIVFGPAGTRANRLPQGYLSWIDIADGSATTRLAPLNELGLEAARAAGDAQVQYLEHNPAQSPALLSALAGAPLTVSLIRRSRRPALQLDEGDERFAVYAEGREAFQVDAAQQTTVAATRRAQPTPGDTNAQLAAAIAEAQQAMEAAGLSMPNLPIAQTGHGAPATGAASAAQGNSAYVLRLDSNQRAMIEFAHAEGLAITLQIIDKQSGRQLLTRDFPDGVIRESVDFSQFGLSLNQIGVMYIDANNRILGSPALAVAD